MDPATRCCCAGGRRLPRTRGDGPELDSDDGDWFEASPHTRGWTAAVAGELADGRGFPAHAGMDRRPRPSTAGRRGLPRTRGDGPHYFKDPHDEDVASPHTRGWTRVEHQVRRRLRGFPAHAGMDPAGTARVRLRTGLPRTRGDGPFLIVSISSPSGASPHTRGWTPCPSATVGRMGGFPAHAGMDPRRTRGCRMNVGAREKTRFSDTHRPVSLTT